MSVKRRMKVLAAGTVILAAAAVTGAAYADGMPGRGKAAYEKPTTWSGVYFGVHSGWAWADIQSDFVPAGSGSDSVNHDAPMVGGQIGIQHQWGNLVLGVEAGFSSAFQDGYANVTCPNVTRTCGKRLDDIFTVGPRLGWAMGKWMPYLTGGYANASISHESYDTGAVTNLLLGRERFSGWFIGGGVEMALAHGFTAGIEYRHMEFGDETFRTFTPAGVLSGDVRTVDPSIDTVTLRVNWKFDRLDRVGPLK